MSSSSVNEGVLFCMGNPLLDISATVDLDYIKKYGLKENDAILAEEKHMPIYEEMAQKDNVAYIPGGATQNTARIAQWFLQDVPHATTYAGCIKDDKFGGILQKACADYGVRTIYLMNKGPEPTGLCAVLVNGVNRSLVTNLAAACKYQVEHLSEKENWALVEKAKYFYISGFFITSSQDAIMKVAKYSHSADKTFSMNLGAPFLCSFFKDQLLAALEYTDLIFGNETEAQTLAESAGFSEKKDVGKIAVLIAGLPYKKADKTRTVIITQGADSICVVREGALTLFPVSKLKADQIVDTNGAGDAFAGGFLAQLVQGKSIEESLRCGIWTSQLIIQRSGCTFPKGKPDYS